MSNAKALRYSDLQVGDVIKDTTKHGRVYVSTVTKVGYSKIVRKNLCYPIELHRKKMYSFECEGKPYEKKAIGKVSQYESVYRDGEKIH